MTNINGQAYLVRNNYNAQQLATMPKAQQQEYINYLYGTGASDEVVFNTYNSDGNYCTDGKDDGKIGFFSALGNATQGVLKTIGSGIKGMFTGADGKFSLLKTIGSVAMAAACIAFPAVGLAACAVGGVMGAVQVGKGVYNAAKAETDAEAKAAWENIGGGVFTVASSVVGAKASLSAVKGTSTAGLSGLDDAAAAAAKAQGKTSALSQLDDAATIGQKAGALLKDMGSSSVNNFKGIKAGLASMKKTNSDFKEIKALEKQKSDILQKQAKGEALTDADNAILKKWDDLGSQGYSEKALAKASDYNEGQFLKSELSQAKASKNKVAIKDAKTNLKNYNAEHSLYQNAKTTVQNGVNSLKDTNIAKALKGLKDLSNTDKLKMIGYGIDADVTNIINAMNQGVPANTLVAQYGYNNVAQVINAVVGTTYADQAI